MSRQFNFVIEDLSNQVARLSKERAILYAIAVEKEHEIKQLKEELNRLQKENKELDKQLNNSKNDD